MHASIAAIEYFLPEATLDNETLSARFPEWNVEKISAKTGIRTRHIASTDEFASDLAVAAANKLFASGVCLPTDIDFLLLCTQTPDYALPTTACLVQRRLNIPTTVGAMDFNLGCSGFVYGLGLAEGLIASNQARVILLVTTDTLSRYVGREDKGCLTLFGDGATATLITAVPQSSIGPFLYGTDGQGGMSIIARNSGTRRSIVEPSTNCKTPDDSTGHLYMNGSKVFEFAIQVVPRTVHELLDRAGLSQSEIDLFAFHQANAYMLEELRRILNIPTNKFQLSMAHCGNTSSSSIPIALKEACKEGRLQAGSVVMLVSFGVGYSWAATILKWTGGV
jgi:3-oxoacyl-[acyl-carrier-protein] synthase-3